MGQTYDARDWILGVNVRIIDAGRDRGEFVRVSRDDPKYRKSVGINSLVLNRNTDPSYNADVILMKSSASNDWLSALNALDDVTPGGIVFPWFLRQRGTATLIVAETAKIVRDPLDSGLTVGEEVGTYTWGFVLTNVRKFFGGMPVPQLAPVQLPGF